MEQILTAFLSKETHYFTPNFRQFFYLVGRKFWRFLGAALGDFSVQDVWSHCQGRNHKDRDTDTDGGTGKRATKGIQ
jgi:hypothetical protein